MDRRALVLLLVASSAHADKKIQAMTPGFQREAQTCTTQVSGLRKVQTGATALAPTLSADDKAALDKDLEALAAGLKGVEAYCTAVTELVAFLEANKDASYKSAEKELDTRDNNVRKLRKASKATIDAMTPITRKWIGRIAQNQVQKPDEPKAKPVAFPSGRSVVLPNLGKGTWSVSGGKEWDSVKYQLGEAFATIMVSPIYDGCDAEKKRRELQTLEDPIAKADGLEIVWHGGIPVRAFRNGGNAEILCMRTNGLTLVAVITESPGPTDKLAALRQLSLDMARSQAPAAKTP